ncbi:MAG: DUF4157 domain-containing protein [Candidatus Manganitrophus sp. SA1]|nr:DUF4157 domain-containing protein [Candidatus Manganitrophus morganii]
MRSMQKQNQPPQRASSNVARSSPSENHQKHPSLHLQRTAGNQAVQRLQAKLTISSSGDIYEQEADCIAEQVMRTPAPQLQRACACGATCPKCQTKPLQTKRIEPGHSEQTTAPPIVHDALRSSGQPLDPVTRAFMEPRFGYDFSHVRVHTDLKAAISSQSIQALAYTAGRDIVFASDQYSPQTESGKRLLAHELAHVVQQGDGQPVDRISRFSDTDHHILEEAALELTKLTPGDIKQIHAGNVKRDYSQTGAVANLLLLCDAKAYGGYKAEEHFDNYQWNEQLQKWQSKKNPGAFGKKSPISYIDEELVRFADALPDPTAFEHVGNAFHTIEDFFAHSNFVELISGDFRFGKKLVTGGGGSGDTSVLRILESVSSEETSPFYGQQAAQETAKSPPHAHARLAKDYKSNPYYMQAVVMAALVIKDIGAEISVLRGMTTKDARVKQVREVIMAKVKRYLRPPEESDKWWEGLRASGGKEMEKLIKEKMAKTPVTKNQCILSPLRSIEASKNSNLKLFGPAFPIETKQGHVWVQVGTGFLAPPAFKGASGAVEPRSFDFVPVGVQITGTFDLLK